MFALIKRFYQQLTSQTQYFDKNYKNIKTTFPSSFLTIFYELRQFSGFGLVSGEGAGLDSLLPHNTRAAMPSARILPKCPVFSPIVMKIMNN